MTPGVSIQKPLIDGHLSAVQVPVCLFVMFTQMQNLSIQIFNNILQLYFRVFETFLFFECAELKIFLTSTVKPPYKDPSLYRPAFLKPVSLRLY